MTIQGDKGYDRVTQSALKDENRRGYPIQNWEWVANWFLLGGDT